ncbi:MAG TPA: hypothetical protein VIL35_11455 [Vicinamibacterales bacterium]
MALGKTAALTAGFIGAFGLGVLVGPSVVNREAEVTTAPAARAPVAEPAPAAAPVARRPTPVETRMAALSASAPQLHERLKPLLNRGTRMELAADGFRDAEQFATVAHAARNTEVPFAVLKHRVLNEGKSLAQAIREMKPEVDATAEVRRARAAARADLAEL